MSRFKIPPRRRAQLLNSKPAGLPLRGLYRVSFASGVAALPPGTANSLEKNAGGRTHQCSGSVAPCSGNVAGATSRILNVSNACSGVADLDPQEGICHPPTLPFLASRRIAPDITG